MSSSSCAAAVSVTGRPSRSNDVVVRFPSASIWSVNPPGSIELTVVVVAWALVPAAIVSSMVSTPAARSTRLRCLVTTGLTSGSPPGKARSSETKPSGSTVYSVRAIRTSSSLPRPVSWSVASSDAPSSVRVCRYCVSSPSGAVVVSTTGSPIGGPGSGASRVAYSTRVSVPSTWVRVASRPNSS